MRKASQPSRVEKVSKNKKWKKVVPVNAGYAVYVSRMVMDRNCRFWCNGHLDPVVVNSTQGRHRPIYDMIRIILYAYDGVYNTPLGQFSKRGCSITKRVSTPDEISSESFRRDVSNAQMFRTGATPIVEISTMENRPTGV